MSFQQQSLLYHSASGKSARGKILSSLPIKMYQKSRTKHKRLLIATTVCIGITWLAIWATLGSRKHELTKTIPARLVARAEAVSEDEYCGIDFRNLYSPITSRSSRYTIPLCTQRAQLLQALGSKTSSSADQPFPRRECTYRWFSPEEICGVLDHFDALAFVGDEVARKIYMGLNILLRQDMQLGAMQGWTMNSFEKDQCRCNNQFSQECQPFVLTSTVDSDPTETGYKICDRFPHAYIPVNGFKQYQTLTFNKPAPWKPSPMIFSVAQDLTFKQAHQSLGEWILQVVSSGVDTPILILGPESNGTGGPAQAGEDYVELMRQVSEASRAQMEVLSLWNLMPYETESAQKTAIVEAMMVVNWLSRLSKS